MPINDWSRYFESSPGLKCDRCGATKHTGALGFAIYIHHRPVRKFVVGLDCCRSEFDDWSTMEELDNYMLWESAMPWSEWVKLVK